MPTPNMDRQLLAVGGTGPQELKQQIYAQLKKSGVVSSLKSQLRTQLLDQLRNLAGPDAVKAAAAAGADQHPRSMWHNAVNCMVAEYLQSCGCQFTLSVLKSEAELAEQPAFSVEDLCQLMRLDRQPRLLERVQQLLQTEGCLAIALVQALSSTGGSATVDSGCQTSTTGQMEGLSRRLLQLEDSYMAKASQKQGAVSRVTLDEQMAAYKQECDALVEVQVAARVARMKEVELAAARQDAAAKYRQQLELDRAELDRIHADRLARLAAREDEVTEKLRRQQRDVESVAYTQRQRILAEEERIRGMKAEVGRQLEIQEQLLKGLEAQLKEREKAVSAREQAAESKLAEAAELETKLAAAARKQAAAELAEEQAALRGERSALEAERARVSELRQTVNADLAVARAKEDRLRTLESARAEAEARSAAHAAGEEVLRLQLKQLQTELTALQQELVRAGAAAAAGQQQLYPSGEAAAAASAVDAVLGGGSGPVQLSQALRDVGQLRKRAQEAESAVDEAMVERDAAVSRAEELLVNLNAARREVTALRNQVTRQQQDIIQVKLQLSQTHAAAMAAGVSGRNTALGVRGSVSSLRVASPSYGAAAAAVAGPVAGLGLYSTSPPTGVVGVGLGSANLAAHGGSAFSAAAGRAGSSPVPGLGLRSRAMTTGGLGEVWGSSARGVLGHMTAAGADEVQAAASRIAQLAAADASMSQRLADFRRRSAVQRAAAARQLADLKAVAGSSSGGAGSSSAGGAAAAEYGLQQYHRSSAPSIDDGSVEELLHQQQRREALEIALQPPAVTAAQLAAAAAAAARPYSREGRPGSSPAGVWNHMPAADRHVGGAAAAAAAAGAGIYRLDDVLRAAGSLRGSAGSPQQQQQQQDLQQLQQERHVQAQQQQELGQQLLEYQGQQQDMHDMQQQCYGVQEQQQQQEILQHAGHDRVQHQHQQWDGHNAAASDIQFYDAGAALLPPRPPSSSTELSFIQQLQHSGVTEDSADSHDISSSNVTLRHEQAHQPQQLQLQQQQVDAEQQVGMVRLAGSSDHAAVQPAAVSTQWQQPEQQGEEHSSSQGHVGSGSNSSGAGVWIDRTAAAAAAAADDAFSTTTTAAAAADPVTAAELSSQQHAEAVQLQLELQQGLQDAAAAAAAAGDTAAADEHGYADAPAAQGSAAGAAVAAAAEDLAGAYADPGAEADAIDEGIDLADDFIAELSAISSAVAMEAAAAAMEGVRLSGSSIGMTASAIGVDRYGSSRGGGYDPDEEDSQDGDHQPEPHGTQQQDHDDDYDYQLEAPGQHQQQQQQLFAVPSAPYEVRGSEGSWAYPGDDLQQKQGGQYAEGSASPGWSEVNPMQARVWGGLRGSFDDDGSVSDGQLAAVAAGAAGMMGQIQSPPSSEGSVF